MNMGIKMGMNIDEYGDWEFVRGMVACEPHFCPLSWSQHAAPNATVYKKVVKQILETSKIRSVAKLCSGGD